MKTYGASEYCNNCETEIFLPGWKREDGFVVTCQNCGSQIFLCDQCLHEDDNPEQKCDWHEETRDGVKYSCCFRGCHKA